MVSISRRALVGAAATLGLSLAAIAAPAQEPVTITFFHYQTGNYDALRAILDDFEVENPDIVVEDVFSQSQQITADVQAALAAGRQVDIATVIGKNIIFFLNNTPAVPLNTGPDGAEWLDAYLPNFLDLGRVGEEIYAIPHAYGTPMIYYNRDLFEAAGLDPDVPPTTWPAVIEAAQTIQAATGIAGVAHLHASNKDYGTMLMVTNAGAEYLSEDGRCALFDSEPGIAVLQMWQDLANTHDVMPIANDRQWSAAFQAGQLAMYMTSSAALRAFVASAEGNFDLGVANYPLFEAGLDRRVPNSGGALMLYSPEGPRRDAALRLLAYLSAREVSNRWARESGYMPVAQDPLADPAMAAYVETFPLVQPVIRQMAETVPTATWGEVAALEAQTIVSDLIDALWADEGPAAELVPVAVARMNEVMECPGR